MVTLTYADIVNVFRARRNNDSDFCCPSGSYKSTLHLYALHFCDPYQFIHSLLIHSFTTNSFTTNSFTTHSFTHSFTNSFIASPKEHAPREWAHYLYDGGEARAGNQYRHYPWAGQPCDRMPQRTCFF